MTMNMNALLATTCAAVLALILAGCTNSDSTSPAARQTGGGGPAGPQQQADNTPTPETPDADNPDGDNGDTDDGSDKMDPPTIVPPPKPTDLELTAFISDPKLGATPIGKDGAPLYMVVHNRLKKAADMDTEHAGTAAARLNIRNGMKELQIGPYNEPIGSIMLKDGEEFGKGMSYAGDLPRPGVNNWQAWVNTFGDAGQWGYWLAVKNAPDAPGPGAIHVGAFGSRPGEGAPRISDEDFTGLKNELLAGGTAEFVGSAVAVTPDGKGLKHLDGTVNLTAYLRGMMPMIDGQVMLHGMAADIKLMDTEFMRVSRGWTMQEGVTDAGNWAMALTSKESGTGTFGIGSTVGAFGVYRGAGIASKPMK